MLKKKRVYDKVMLLSRLKEEEVIVVHEVQQHWEYLKSVVGMIKELSSQLSEGLTQQSKSNIFQNLHGCPEPVTFICFPFNVIVRQH